MSGGADETARRLAAGMGAEPAGWAGPGADALKEAIPGLRVLGVAGRGGMGVVYRAEQTRLGRPVALKVLAPAGAASGAGFDPLAAERFEREARVMAGVAHPNVLRIFDAGKLADGTLYLVTEWAEGGDLAGLAGGRAQAAERVVDWTGQIAAALDAAHARGIVHRDLKPANVLVRADGGLALGDFGLARAEGAGFTTTLTLSGMVYGTFDYMAPEQMGAVAAGGGGKAEITPAADVYALGVMTYQLLTGRVPRGAFEAVSKVAGVPEAVDAVIAAALANDPGRRTQTAGEFARALRVATGGRGKLRGRRRAAAWGAAAAAGLAVAGWGWVQRAEQKVAGRAPVVARATEPVAAVEAGTGAQAGVPGPVGEEARMRDLLSGLDLARVEKRGGWSRTAAGLRSDGAVCWVALPQAVPTGFRYEVEVEFTRLTGRHSVGVFLPTAAGTGVFELDAWEAGLGGLQMIDGRDLKENGTAFPAVLRNGERQRVNLIVEGTRVTMTWNGVARGATDVGGRRFESPWLWEVPERTGLGLCSWQSTTVFHRVEYRER